MQNKQKQMISRGYVSDKIEVKYLNNSFDENINLLQSKIPTDRTLGARLLSSSKNYKTIEFLIEALKIEKKLYPKIEICNSLVLCGEKSIQPLITCLGTIGNNQHVNVPQKEFKKDNYPLPRDIASRTLIRFEQVALDELKKILETKNTKQLSEAIDAIGYICFYNTKSDIYPMLKTCYLKYMQNNLIKWKIIRAMSGFIESKPFLEEQKRLIEDTRLLQEIERSLKFVGD